MTYADLVHEAVRTLTAAGVAAADAQRDASLLARHVLGIDHGRWLTTARTTASADFVDSFPALVARRATREPLAYIVGEREFYGRAFHVSPAVLVPRPETEVIVDEARRRVDGEQTADVADFGTGSGCLAITLALELPGARLVAIDRSPAALAVASANADRHGVCDRVDFRAMSWDDARGDGQQFDLIVANPPYVRDGDRPALMPEVRDFEPGEALFGGAEGLDAIRSLVPVAAATLRPGGWLLMEIGADQATAVERLVAQTSPLALAGVVPDLQCLPRVVIAHVPVLPHHRR